MFDVRVQAEPFDFGAELSGFGTGRDDIGAVVGFCGIVRDDTGKMTTLDIEHYPGMTQKALEGALEQARDRWDLRAGLIIHRFGPLGLGDPIMMVATASRHRAAAYQASEFLMDYLKSRAPFWKREIGPDGSNWVAAKDADEDALKRW